MTIGLIDLTNLNENWEVESESESSFPPFVSTASLAGSALKKYHRGLVSDTVQFFFCYLRSALNWWARQPFALLCSSNIHDFVHIYTQTRTLRTQSTVQVLELITELRWRGPRESEKMLPNIFTLFEVRKTCNSLRHYPKDPVIGTYGNLEGLRRIATATVIVMLFWLVLLFFPICRPHTEPFMIKQHLTLALGFTQIALLVSVAAYRKEVSLPCMFINGTPDFHVIAPIVGTNSVLSGLIMKQQR